MFGTNHPACIPTYTHKFAFRGLIPVQKARDFLGDFKTKARFMHMGPNAHVVTFPVSETLINVAAFVTDPKPWAAPHCKFVMPESKRNAVDAFADFGPTVRHFISLLSEEDLDKWAIFDMFDNPLPTFANKRFCLAGDAAHASSPHQGANAGFGVEDSLAIAELLADVKRRIPLVPLTTMIPEALATYNEMRYERAQWLVRSSRKAGEMYEWQDEETKEDVAKWCEELKLRCHKIWDFDVEEMVRRGLETFNQKLSDRMGCGIP